MGANLETGLDADREYKSTVFSMLFDGNPAAAISASNTFLGTNYGPDTEVTFTTLTRTFTKGKVNDLAFILDNRLIILVEHQSTLCENMPYRMLQYIAETYKRLHTEKKEYQKYRFLLQRPKFIVLYNGVEEMDDEVILRLSDMFAKYGPLDGVADDGQIDLELTLKVYNINRGRNEEMVKRCAQVYGYSILTDMIREYRKTMSLEEAIQKAVVDCIDQDVLKNFLLQRKGEVINMLVSEWKLDVALEVAKEEGEMVGEKRGAKKKALEIANNLRDHGMDVDSVAKATGLTVDDILRL